MGQQQPKPGAERCAVLCQGCLCPTCRHDQLTAWGVRFCAMAARGRERVGARKCEIKQCLEYQKKEAP